ncbi:MULTISPECIES: DegQ family serine endoprotease [unclassified Achromobacter]|uniref:DegQ family serine endoprotease n=1 Tax=unclassified Achromobacter TaxID=2626865 RepID=UPI000B5169E7|nr:MULTISPECIES: DegQ family serine endoprotease [unclassified Achromobacter]OWT77316.1 peptidase [Achromobacter sp. HZ28]OWT78197.1 peptidase [Achromobacter sp. HZ34]
MKNKTLYPTRLALALLAAGAIGGAGISAAVGSAHAQSAPQATQAQQQGPQQAQPAVGTVTPPNFAQITREYGPAVVNISVSGLRKVSAADDEDNPLAQFFGGQFPGMMPGGPNVTREVPIRGEGSGFIISPDGVILTNAHVVKDAKEVVVKLTDRREFHAKVLGADPQTDVAVIKIEAKNLPVVRIGDVGALSVGDWVLAIGSPYGLENTATAGIVSAKGRSLPDDTSVPFIQTDVAVNPGNSGGPLFNDRGQVVGINSQIYTRTGGFQGLSFSIPIDVAYKIKDQILAHGTVEHAKLGVMAQEVNQDLADSFKLDSPTGALIANVEKGSAAEKAGLRPGDIVRAIDGRPIISSGDLAAVINLATPGQKIDLDVWRDGKRETLTASLGTLSKGDAVASNGDQGPSHGKLGLALRRLTPDEREQADTDGLLVQQASGPAAKAGIQRGDVILSVNGVAARSVEQVREALTKAGKTVALLVQRGDSKIFVPVQIG